MANIHYPKDKANPHASVLADIGDIDEGNGCRITLLPHYMLVEIVTEDEGGELWIPMGTLLHLIGNMNRKVGN